MFDKIYNAALEAQDVYELNKSLADTHIDVLDHSPPYFTPAGKLAAGGHYKAAEMLRNIGALVDPIAMGYAFAGTQRMVEE